jgi:hypothetical protein
VRGAASATSISTSSFSTRARHVARLRLVLAPGGEVHQHGEVARLARAVLEALPGALGVLLVGRGRGQDLHLVFEPGAPARLVELGEQRAVDVAQVGDVADRVIDLGLGERSARPVGEARRLVDRDFAHRLCQLAVGDLVAVAAHHRRDLGVEHRRGHLAGELPEDFDVLPRGVKHLDHAGVGHQREQRREIDVGGERVDRQRLVVGRHLDDA